MAWQAGWNKSVSFLGTSLKIKASTWDEHIEKLIVTHSQSLGIQGWIAGVLDGEGTVQAVIDSSLIPPNLLIVPGTMGFIRWVLGSAVDFSIPGGITKVHYSTAVAGLVEYSFDFALNSETGAYVRAS